jgi:hypothetical protein
MILSLCFNNGCCNVYHNLDIVRIYVYEDITPCYLFYLLLIIFLNNSSISLILVSPLEYPLNLKCTISSGGDILSFRFLNFTFVWFRVQHFTFYVLFICLRHKMNYILQYVKTQSK